MKDVLWKRDFEQTEARFAAWWQGEVLDRPPVTLGVKPSRAAKRPQKSHASLRERWMDVEYNVACAIAEMEARDFVGDSLPIYMPNIGPEITATLFGCDLDFGEHTSWSHPIIHNADEWKRVLERAADFQNPYWQAVEAMTDLALQNCDNCYLVGITDLHGNWDILAALRDPQMLCMDVFDCPETVAKVANHVATGFVQAFERLYEKIAAHGQGSTTWLPFYHGGRGYVPSCDFWCMVSDETARELILPSILTEMQTLERSIFHLDGPQALRHLDILLEIPQLSAVQWVYGAGAGPASRWIETYQKIQRSGKSFQLIAETADDALRVLETIGPRGVWLQIDEWFDSIDEADAFLTEVEKRSR
jgi:hypothetical protein